MIEEGTKPRAVEQENIVTFAQGLGVPPERLFETSAQSGKGVQDLFASVATFYVPKAGEDVVDLEESITKPAAGGGCKC